MNISENMTRTKNTNAERTAEREQRSQLVNENIVEAIVLLSIIGILAAVIYKVIN